MGIFIVCVLFTSLVVFIVYLGAFRNTSTVGQSRNVGKKNNFSDFAMIKIRDDRKVGTRKTDYIVFYDPKLENLSSALKFDKSAPIKNRQYPNHDIQLNLFKTWFAFIILFSFIIVIAVQAGAFLYEVYKWFL